MIKKLLRKYGPNPLERLLQKAQKKEAKKVLLFWNRGLGDIALGLYAIVHRIRTTLPDAEITFLTRENLADGFRLLGGVRLIVSPTLKRGDPCDLAAHGIERDDYDLIIEKPDPTYWASWQRGTLTPKLCWKSEWDALCENYGLDDEKKYIGAHVQTETGYALWRDWPEEKWCALFEKLTKEGREILLFGYGNDPSFDIPGVIDLRGKTPLFDLLSIVKNRCDALLVPDSGISSMVYYLDTPFPLKHISLWGETDMGILKQNVPSPNPQLEQIPILGKDRDIRNITPEEVYAHLS